MKIIGVIGQNGSGKDEVLKYLRAKYKSAVSYPPEIWFREIAAREGKEPTRENLQEISQRYFHRVWTGLFCKAGGGKNTPKGLGNWRHYWHTFTG